MSAPATRLPRHERREHLLDVAAALVVGGGVDAVNMEAVAASAGVSKGLGYAYFDNSADLLVALYDREMAALEQRAIAAMTEAPDFEGRIRAAVSAWFDLVSERGALLGALLASQVVRGALEARGKGGQRELEEFYGRMIVREYGVPTEEAVAAAAVLIAGISGALERFGAHKGDRQTLEETYMAIVMGGVRAVADRHR